jgi:hypothetical protein
MSLIASSRTEAVMKPRGDTLPLDVIEGVAVSSNTLGWRNMLWGRVILILCIGAFLPQPSVLLPLAELLAEVPEDPVSLSVGRITVDCKITVSFRVDFLFAVADDVPDDAEEPELPLVDRFSLGPGEVRCS